MPRSTEAPDDVMVDQTFRRSLENGFHVGDYFVEPRLQRVTADGHEIHVEPKVMDVLMCLAETPGEPVSKSRFMEEVWRDAVVTNDALLRCISELRKIFEDDARNPDYVETIRKRGYRLIAPVSLVRPGADAAHSVERAGAASDALTAPRGSRLRSLVRRTLSTVWFWTATASVGVFISVVVLAHLLGGGTIVPYRAVPLTSLPGAELDPSLSPDGERVAFAWDGGSGGGFDIFVEHIGRGTPNRLTRSPAQDLSPAWSPDGQQLAFLRSGGGERGLFVVPATGGVVRQVVELGPRDVGSLDWSPDGSVLTFSAHREPHEPFAIWTYEMESGELAMLTNPPADIRGDVELAYSPDGRSLAFVRSVLDKVDDIYVVSLADGSMRRLTEDHAKVSGLDWSADGRSIVFASARNGSSNVWRIPASGGDPTWMPLSGEGTSVHQPSVAERGARLAFVQQTSETNIWVAESSAPVQGRGFTFERGRPLIVTTQWDSHPALSPNGEEIAFVSTRSGSYELWVSDHGAATPIQVSSFGGPVVETPRWDPDGRRLAFVVKERGSADIYVLPLASGVPTRLTSESSNDKAPVWSRDGRWVYFGSNRSGRWEIWKIPVDGGDAVQVTVNGGFAAAESPDAERLYVVKRATNGIWRMPVGGGEEERVVDDLLPYDWGNWAVVENGIYFIRREGMDAELAFYTFDGGGVEVVGNLGPLPEHPSLSFSPAGERLIYSRIDRMDSDIYLIDDFD